MNGACGYFNSSYSLSLENLMYTQQCLVPIAVPLPFALLTLPFAVLTLPVLTLPFFLLFH